MGALPRAPKNAPACKTETTLEETSFERFVSMVPSCFTRPKCFWKKGCDTTPPAIPLENSNEQMPGQCRKYEYIRVITEENNSPIRNECEPCDIALNG